MKIAWKFVLTSTVILVVALVLTTLISTNRFGQAVTGFAKDDLQRTAEENAAYITGSYDDKTRLSEAIAGDDLIIRSLIDQANGRRGNQGTPASPPYVNWQLETDNATGADMVASTDNILWKQLCVYLNRNWTSYSDQLENLFVGDVYGYAHCGAFEVLNIPTSGIPMNVSGRGGNYWERCIEGRVAFGDLEQSPVPGHNFLASGVATPVKDGAGAVCGLVGVAMNFSPIKKHVEGNKVGDTGYTIVLDRYGRILVHPQDGEEGEENYTLHGLPESATDPLAETYLKDLAGEGWEALQDAMTAGGADFRTVSAGGKDYRVYFTPVGETARYDGMGLSVAAVIEEGELHEEANAMRNTIIVVALIAVLVAIVLSYLVATMIAGPIKKLQLAADKVSKGEMDVVIDTKSKDEVGDLARSFERMVSAVRFLSEDQEKGDKQ